MNTATQATEQEMPLSAILPEVTLDVIRDAQSRVAEIRKEAIQRDINKLARSTLMDVLKIAASGQAITLKITGSKQHDLAKLLVVAEMERRGLRATYDKDQVNSLMNWEPKAPREVPITISLPD